MLKKITSFLLIASVAYCAYPKGIDVSKDQPAINWASVKANGVGFVYIKATDGIAYRSPTFNAQFSGATNSGLIRGAYHFARPDKSGGAAQANFLMASGGGWSPDGITLPAALYMEYNPDGQPCYGLFPSSMAGWISDFSNTYHARTGRYPVIRTSIDWWKQCTNNAWGFQNNNPLWIARYDPVVGELPAGYRFPAFWQYANSGPNPGHQDLFNGESAGLASFVRAR